MIELSEFQKFGKKKDPIKAKPKVVWCYTRVSSKEQKDNFSLGTQRLAAERFANEKGFELVKSFGETYESGKDDFTRKEFMKLLKEVQKTKNRPFAIIVNNMTRFSRSGGKSIAILNELIDKYNVHLIESSSGVSTDTPKGRNDLSHRLLEAEGDNIRKLEVSIPGMKAFLLEGYCLGRAPLGYFHTGPKTADHSRYSQTQKIVLNEDGNKLKQAWLWKLEGVQDYIIVNRLRNLGVYIDAKRVSDMWRNPFYCGLITHSLLDGKIVQGRHEPMVSREVFLQVDRINNRRTQGYTIQTICEERPLVGDLRCSKCKGKLTGYLVRKKGLHYYKCQKCKGVTFNAVTKSPSPDRRGINDLFFDLLKSYQIKPEYLGLVKEQLNKMINLTQFSIQKSDSMVKKRISELEGEKLVLEERFAFGKINENIYQKFSTKIDCEIHELKEKVELPEISTSNFRSNLNKAVDFIQNVSNYWFSGNIQVKKNIQSLLFPNGFYINPENRQYLTPEVNYLFRLTSDLQRISEDPKKKSPLI